MGMAYLSPCLQPSFCSLAFKSTYSDKCAAGCLWSPASSVYAQGAGWPCPALPCTAASGIHLAWLGLPCLACLHSPPVPFSPLPLQLA
jgi:hypothetical protein